MLEQMTETDSAGEPSDTQMDTDQGIEKIMAIYSTTAHSTAMWLFGCHATMTAVAHKMHRFFFCLAGKEAVWSHIMAYKIGMGGVWFY